MIAIIGIGTWLGVKLDEWYPNPKNIYTLLMATASILIAIYYVIKRITKLSKDE
jgi:hypothetical protein